MADVQQPEESIAQAEDLINSKPAPSIAISGVSSSTLYDASEPPSVPVTIPVITITDASSSASTAPFETKGPVPTSAYPPKPAFASAHTETTQIESRVSAALAHWFTTFDVKALMLEFENVAGAYKESYGAGKEFAEGVVFGIVKESIGSGSGAGVAKSARVVPELIERLYVSEGDVKNSLEKFIELMTVNDPDEPMFAVSNLPTVYKYFGIFYGVLLGKSSAPNSVFTLDHLAHAFSHQIQNDSDTMYLLKLVSQVLSVVQLMKGDAGLAEVVGELDLKAFWPPGTESEVVKDFLEAISLEFLVQFVKD
ncbi:hypothetical protein HDU98_011015 [Podochytrium sp. JEL0797]|nr:hypothetical protein HDU98_011015 [Podochytrium sp. JEL0797]